MVELALFTGLFAGCVVGVRALIAIVAIIALSLPTLAISVGLDGVQSAIMAIVAVQVGYASAALMPVGFQYASGTVSLAR